MGYIKTMSIATVLTCCFSTTVFALSDVRYKNLSSHEVMHIGSSELQPGAAYLHKVLPGDTETIVIGDKTFMITDLHEVCAKVSHWPYSPTGWKMELSVDGNRVGVICAKEKLFEFITMAHSTFTLTGVLGKHKVTYSDAGSMWISGDYPLSMASVSYSW